MQYSAIGQICPFGKKSVKFSQNNIITKPGIQGDLPAGRHAKCCGCAA
jgi:hypothetical protein